MAPDLTLELFSLFILKDPTIMIAPQAAPIKPQIATIVLTAAAPAMDDKVESAANGEVAIIRPAIT